MEEKIKIVPIGYFVDEPDPRDNIFGSEATPAPIILPSGDWSSLFIPDEFQNKIYDNYGCITYTILNAIEKLAKLFFNEEWNKAERFTYIASETIPGQGNSPRKVA